MKIGLYVGSFDPVHIGHKNIIYHLLKTYVDEIVVVPTNNYWDKTTTAELKKRTDMLKFYENEKVKIDEELSEYSYTYQIIEEMKKKYKESTIYLIIGSDLLKMFYLWKNVDKVLENKILVIPRNEDDINLLIEPYAMKKNFILVNDIEKENISSTRIRSMIKNHESVHSLVDESILEYIKKNNLYGGNLC